MALTEQDIDTIERIVDDKLEPLKGVPAKLDEILTIVSDMAGQLKGTQEEQTVQGKHLSNHEDRITALENSSTH